MSSYKSHSLPDAVHDVMEINVIRQSLDVQLQECIKQHVDMSKTKSIMFDKRRQKTNDKQSVIDYRSHVCTKFDDITTTSKEFVSSTIEQCIIIKQLNSDIKFLDEEIEKINQKITDILQQKISINNQLPQIIKKKNDVYIRLNYEIIRFNMCLSTDEQKYLIESYKSIDDIDAILDKFNSYINRFSVEKNEYDVDANVNQFDKLNHPIIKACSDIEHGEELIKIIDMHVSNNKSKLDEIDSQINDYIRQISEFDVQLDSISVSIIDIFRQLNEKSKSADNISYDMQEEEVIFEDILEKLYTESSNVLEKKTLMLEQYTKCIEQRKYVFDEYINDCNYRNKIMIKNEKNNKYFICEIVKFNKSLEQYETIHSFDTYSSPKDVIRQFIEYMNSDTTIPKSVSRWRSDVENCANKKMGNSRGKYYTHVRVGISDHMYVRRDDINQSVKFFLYNGLPQNYNALENFVSGYICI